MNFEISEDQQMMRETFARFLDKNSSMARVRAALSRGFDPALWSGLAELGAFSLRVPEASGGLGLGLLDAAILMEEVGRTLASGPVAETLVAARLLANLGGADTAELLGRVISGETVVGLAFRDIADEPVQWVAAGAVAEAVIARNGEQIVLVAVPESERKAEANLASTAMAELRFAGAPHTLLADDAGGRHAFAQAIEEWKLLMSSALAGLSRQAVHLAAAYARDRVAFGQPIGSYQGIAHPLADLICDVDGGKYFTWMTVRDIADGKPEAGAEISLALWWNAETANRAVAHALQTFGGYGLTTDYDIHLYNLRAKAWPLIGGDPTRLLEEAGRRFYGGETAALPDAGAVTIDFDLGEEARALADELDAFFRKNLTPELKAKAHYSWEGHDPGLHQKLAQAGLLFLSWPKELGGRDAPPYARHAAMHVWEKYDWTTAPTSVAGMVGTVIRRYGSDELKRDVLSKIVSGESICSLGYSEPGCGSDVFAAATRATRDGDGWRIDGQKMFTSGANIADYVLMLTRTDPNVPKHKGLTMFIVPLKAPGVEIKPVYTFQDERTNITYYDGVKIPDSYRRPLIEDRDAQVRLARARAHLLLSEVLAWRALWAGAEKKPGPGFGPMAKLFSSEKFLTDSADLLNLTAPYSLSKREGPAAFLNQCYRHAHGTRIYGGTSQVHRSMIAERNLGLPRTRA
jgi:alkylation response protein AidB-like acyl-CoA dehydrogenase